MTSQVSRGTSQRRARREDAGAATVLAVGIIVMCLSLLTGTLEVARAVTTSHRAAAGADLAALAGAQEAAGASEASACQAAAKVASLNGASLEGCLAGLDGTVTVWVSVVSTGPWQRRAVARSRAGPVGATERPGPTPP